jgi:general secretion pathway protein M
MAVTLPVGRQGHVLAVGLLVFAVVVVWLGVIAPVLSFYGDRAEELASLRARVARGSALIEALPALTREAARAAKAPTQAVLQGASDAIAGATLQEQVQGMAASTNAQLTSIETLPGEQVGAYRRIGVRVELSAQLAVVTHLLEAIEQAQPSMLVDDIRLTATPVGPQNAQLPMDVAFTVYAFRIGTAKDDQQ